MAGRKTTVFVPIKEHMRGVEAVKKGEMTKSIVCHTMTGGMLDRFERYRISMDGKGIVIWNQGGSPMHISMTDVIGIPDESIDRIQSSSDLWIVFAK